MVLAGHYKCESKGGGCLIRLPFLNAEGDRLPFLARAIWPSVLIFEQTPFPEGHKLKRSEKAIARPTPELFALYSIMTLLAAHLVEANHLPVRSAAWYAKERATFSDTLAYVRRWL